MPMKGKATWELTRELKKRAQEAREEEREENWAAKSKDEEKKGGNVDIWELDTNTEEDVWEGVGEHEAEGGLEDKRVSTPRP